jgi:tripartite-type tricarboxylate transporter receptor subunit TctC
MHRRHALALCVIAGRAKPQSWPERQVTIISPFPPGLAGDVLARLLAPPLAASWGQPVVVENIPGASGITGVDRAVRAAPDGHTLVLSGDAAIVVRVSMAPSPPYDARRDLTGISRLARTRNLLLASNSLGVSDLASLLALARARPGQLTYGHTGIGVSTHLGMEALKQQAGLDITEVPYGNPALLVPDLVQGRIGLAISSTPAVIERARSGELRALAVTSRDRMPALPDVPTLAESGFPGFDIGAWFGLLAGARVPPPVLARIESTLREVMAEPGLRRRIEALGLVPEGDGTAEAFNAALPAETARMAEVLRPLGLHR